MPAAKTAKKPDNTRKSQTTKAAKNTTKKVQITTKNPPKNTKNRQNTTKKAAVQKQKTAEPLENKGLGDNPKAIENEIRRLTGIFQGASSERKRLLREAIRDAAFASVMMKELSAKILKEGIEIEYQNGENQKGVKQSPAAQLYLQFSRQLNQTMKFLNEALPKEQQPEKKPEDDGFDAFVLGREDV